MSEEIKNELEVALLARAWIEILLRKGGLAMKKVALLARAWIEML